MHSSPTPLAASHTSPILVPVDDNQQNRSQSLQPPASASSPPASATTATLGSTLAPSIRRHRSVKSITRGYEEQQSGTATSSTSTKSQLTPDHRPRSNHSASSSSPPLEEAASHNRRASVLLASASYPSTLSIGGDSNPYARQRTISSSSVSAGDQDRSPSLKLASAAYPSSYSNSSSPHSGRSPLPLPVPAASRTDMSDKPGIATTASLPMLNVSLEGGMDEEGGKANSDMEEEEEDQVGELSGSAGARNPLAHMTAAERRDHSRKHSRVHSRNLSVFFPRPGSEAEKESDAIQAAEHFGKPAMTVETQGLTRQDGDRLGVASESSSVSVSPSKSRRGHHRKHSVTHGLYASDHLSAHNTSAISPSSTSASDLVSPWASSPEQSRTDTGARAEAGASLSRSASLVSAGPITPIATLERLPASHRPLLLFGSLHFVLGAMLWINGQSGDSLSITGLGYLVVFDAFGILSVVTSDWLCAGWKDSVDAQQTKANVRRPYG